MNSLTLQEVAQLVENSLNALDLNNLWIEAKVHEISEAQRGHCYLNLVHTDPNDQITTQMRATIWASAYATLKPYFYTETGMQLQPGIKIRFKGKVRFHKVYGLSINLYDLDPSYSLGEIELAKQKVINQLLQDGVFELNKTHIIPEPIQRIAVISSPTAAGFQDFVHQLEHNSYGYQYELELFAATVQGEEAPESIMDALDRIHQSTEPFDIVALIRGGGSKSDLLCFDHYELCSYLAQYPLPIFAGIGHERDVSVADMVAHTSSKTPTATAETILLHTQTLHEQLLRREQQLQQLVAQKLQQAQQQLETKLYSLKTAAETYVQKKHYALEAKKQALINHSKLYFRTQENKLNLLEKELKHSNPRHILKQGYSLVEVDGKRVRTVSELQLTPNSLITNVMEDGKILSIPISPKE